MQPDDNSSSSERSLVGFGLLFVTQREQDYLFFSHRDHTALSPMFSAPLPRPPVIAPDVSSTPESLQATVSASRARDHLQRPAAGISPRSTTVTSFANAPSPSAELSWYFELCLHGTVLYVTQGNTRWDVISEALLSETRGGVGGHTQREWWLRKISLRSFDRHIARRLHSLAVLDKRYLVGAAWVFDRWGAFHVRYQVCYYCYFFCVGLFRGAPG